MSRWKRTLTVLAIVVVGGAAYLWFFGPQTFSAFQTRKIGREIPIVKSVPAKLQNLSVSQAPGQKVSLMGIEFETPWGDVDQSKSKIVGTWALIVFPSGRSILYVNEPKVFMTGMFREKIGTRNCSPDCMARTFSIRTMP